MSEAQKVQTNQTTPLSEESTTGSTTDRFAQGEEFVQDRFHRFAGKADALYSSKAFDTLPATSRQKIDKVIYDQYVNTLYFMGRKPPGEAWWNSQTKDQKLAFIKNTQPKTLEPLSFGEHLDLTSRAIQNKGIEMVRAAPLIIQHAARGFYGDKIADNWPGMDKGAQGRRDYWQKSFMMPELKYTEDRLNAFGPAANQQLSVKVNKAVSGFIPDAIMLGLLAYTPMGPEAISSRIGLTEFLLSQKWGKAALTAFKSAVDGFYFGAAHGEEGKELAKQVGGWAVFGAGTSILHSSVSTIWSAVSAVTARLAGLFGKDLIHQSMQQTMENLGKETVEGAEKEVVPETAQPKDPTIRRLDEHNAEVLNAITRTMFGQGKLYQFLNTVQKQQVNAEVEKAMARGFNFPAAFDPITTTKAVQDNAKKASQASPQIAKSTNELIRLTQQATGKPVLQAAAKNVAEQTNTTLGRVVVDGKVRYKPAEGEVTAGFEQHVNPNWGPGAAHKYSPEFTEDNMLKALAQRPYFESAADQDALDYWMARNRPNFDPELKKKIITAYELKYPDPEFRAGIEAGIVEHMHKLHTLNYLNRFSGAQEKGQLGHIFRSGNYMADELRGEYDLPKTKWQEQLDKEYLAKVKGKGQTFSQKIHVFPDPIAARKTAAVPQQELAVAQAAAKYEVDKEAAIDFVAKYLDKTKDNALANMPADVSAKYEALINTLANSLEDHAQQKGLLNELKEVRDLAHINKIGNRYHIWMRQDLLSLVDMAAGGSGRATGANLDPTQAMLGILRLRIIQADSSNNIVKRIMSKAGADVLDKFMPYMGDRGIPILSTVKEVPTPRGIEKRTLSIAKGTAGEEHFHGTQRELGGGSISEMLPMGEFGDLALRTPPEMRSYLNQYGYDVSDPILVVGEATAKLATQPAENFGMTPAQSASYLSDFFSRIKEEHGLDALNRFQFVRGPGKEALRDVKARK